MVADGAATEFRVQHAAWIVSEEAAEGLADQHRRDERPLLVTYARSSEAARELLREGGVSYAGEDGRLFLRAPGLFVDRDDRLGAAEDESGVDWPDTMRNPFAGRASRIARWLTLHPNGDFTQAEIAREVRVSPALVSRTLRALEQEGFVRPTSPPTEARRRVTVQRARRLLDRWVSSSAGRPLRQHHWDLGAESVSETIAAVAQAASEMPVRGWAVGGLAGAATIRRVVEPFDVLLWAAPEAVAGLEEALLPAPGRRRQAGSVRVAVVQDPWILTRAVTRDGLPVVDDVQLYLDCVREGERAYEAAEAIAQEAGW